MPSITVHTAPAYDIHIGAGLLPSIGERLRKLFPKAVSAAVVTDDIVHGLYAPALLDSLRAAGFKTAEYVFPNGEESKNHERLLEIYGFLSANAVTRSDVIVALGGGVAGDLAGYAAATWLRGVPYVQIPTTFLAAVDSSVGGKTAVNIPTGKNLVGAFWQPRLVVCDTDTLATLPHDIFCDGVAESIKYGVLFDETLFDLLADGRAKERLDEIIRRCVDYKRQVVEEDERDTGRRQLLNFGHTLGHAIERETHFAISHGKAVGIGMVELTERTERLGISASGTAERIASALRSYDMQTHYEGRIRDLIPAMRGDKKRHGGELSFVVAQCVGLSRLHPVKVDALEDFLCGKGD